MSKDISTLSNVMDKVLDLGSIDRWLRGAALIVPQAADLEDPVSTNFNRHTFSYSEMHDISPKDIKKMVGFRQLMAACSKNNIAIDLKRFTKNSLELEFLPTEPFDQSRIFGQNYTKVLPEILSMDVVDDIHRMN